MFKNIVEKGPYAIDLEKKAHTCDESFKMILFLVK